jgi:hypothetical protein
MLWSTSIYAMEHFCKCYGALLYLRCRLSISILFDSVQIPLSRVECFFLLRLTMSMISLSLSLSLSVFRDLNAQSKSRSTNAIFAQDSCCYHLTTTMMLQ